MYVMVKEPSFACMNPGCITCSQLICEGVIDHLSKGAQETCDSLRLEDEPKQFLGNKKDVIPIAVHFVCCRRPIFLSTHLPTYLPTCLPTYLASYLSICLPVYLFISIYLSIYPSIHPSIHPSIYPSIYRIYRIYRIYLQYLLFVTNSHQQQRWVPLPLAATGGCIASLAAMASYAAATEVLPPASMALKAFFSNLGSDELLRFTTSGFVGEKKEGKKTTKSNQMINVWNFWSLTFSWTISQFRPSCWYSSSSLSSASSSISSALMLLASQSVKVSQASDYESYLQHLKQPLSFRN